MIAVDRGKEKRASIKDVDVVSPPAPVEVELKLRASPGSLDRIRTSPVILQDSRNKGTIRRLETTYYDTADHKLFGAGISLRVRRSGKYLVQTIKRVSVDDPLIRNEWEAPVETLTPDLGALPVSEIDGIFDKIAVDQFVPIFVTKVRRHRVTVDVSEGQIEVAFDDGVIEAGSQQEPLCEVELELKQGRAAALYQLGLGLMDISPLCLETQSKSARGYALALGIDSVAVKASSSNLGCQDTVDEGIAKLLSNCQQQIQANLSPAENGGEGVHQLRVALRRLRTALYFLRREFETPSLLALDGEARRFARTLGPARNWDVFINSTLADIEKSNLPDIDFSSLRAASVPFRNEGYGIVRDNIAELANQPFSFVTGARYPAEKLAKRGCQRGSADTCRATYEICVQSSHPYRAKGTQERAAFSPSSARSAAQAATDLEETALCYRVLLATLCRPGTDRKISQAAVPTAGCSGRSQ